MSRIAPLVTWVGMSVALAANATAAPADPDGVAFFERSIRPVLVRECYECHSAGAKVLKGGLRLDSRAGVLAGGDSGPAVVPGKPDDSPLIAALRHDGVEMPPRGKLPESVVADFVSWVRSGAPDPRGAETVARTVTKAADPEAGRQFWAYRPPRRHPAPPVSDPSWPANEIDRFTLAAMEARGLRPGRDADRVTLVRRLSFDLTGLPPTPVETDAFVNDPARGAYERLVDRLLASPHFGERWGRHWLDVARFAESLTLRGFVLPSAWRYRDYVIEAFNADRPFERLVREQVAGDLLPAGGLDERRRQIAAVAFLLLGNTNLEEQDKAQLRMDVVDEQVDTLGKAFLAQTVGCARCHDHKFDPIPTRDYYALAGILSNTKVMEHANVSKWVERPWPMSPEDDAAYKAREAEIAGLEARIKAERARSRGATGRLAAGDLPGVVVDDAQARRVGDWQESTSTGTFVGAGYLHDRNADKGQKTLTFQPDLTSAGEYEVRLAYSPGSGRASAVPVTVMSADGETERTVDMTARPPVGGRFVSLGRFRFERGGMGYVLVSNGGTRGHVTADAVQFLPVAEAAKAGVGASGETLARLEAELARVRREGPARPTVITVLEEPQIAEARVHLRGSVHTLGARVPRGVLRVATTGPAPAFPSGESGRRELAEWLAGRDNPLTARVFVNRAWHWLFGAGLVRTTDNFGTTGEPPSHPGLLDDLAVRFMDDGWSVKSLVRRIVLSHTYRLASDDTPASRRVDPENRLLTHAHRRRLDAECLRDAMLAAAGTLRRDMGGPGFPADLAADYGFHTEAPRRSVYIPVFRNALPDLLRAFDFPDPGTVVGRRDVSTVAPQALVMMNHPFVAAQARAAARRVLAERGLSVDRRVDAAYRLALGRRPTTSETGACREALADTTADPESGWTDLMQALFASPDFRRVE